MMKKLLLIGAIGMSAIACGGNATPANTANTNSNATANAANTPANAPAGNANAANSTSPANSANTNKPADANAGKATDSGPKRVSFAAGKSEGNENVTLAAGESKQFVVGAKTGQIFMVDADSKDLEITMVKGKDSAQMKEPGHYDSTLIADGDFVFQVKNTSKKEVKSSLKIIISHTGISK